tara:strand:+ start:881 stop:1102 length:222 start_codon:yes stop_codon:yes gene_type:complete
MNDYYKDALSKLKSTSKRKQFLEKEILKLENTLGDVFWALDMNGWLLGNRVTEDDAISLEEELDYIKLLYNSL